MVSDMSDSFGVAKASISDRMHNIVKVGIQLDGDWTEEKYQIYIESIIGSLKVDVPGGVDDIYLIKNAISENEEKIFDDLEEGYIEIHMQESGEWDDVFWNSWYEITKIVRHNYI